MHRRLGVGLKRYFALRQLLNIESKKVNYGISVLTTLQLATLMIPLDENAALPWNYDLFWPVWFFLNSLCRPDRLLQLSTSSSDFLIYFYAVLLLGRIASILTLAMLCGAMRKEEYWKLTTERGTKGAWKSLWRADMMLKFVVSRALGIPGGSLLVSALVCSSQCLSFSSLILAAFSLPISLSITLIDCLTSCDIMLQKDSEGPIKPAYAMMMCSADLAAAILVPLCSIGKHDFIVRAGVLACGLIRIAYIYRDLPFHTSPKNACESFKGQILLWQAVILTLALNTEPSLAPSLLFLFGTPLVFSVNLSVITWLERRMNNHDFVRSEAEHAKALQRLWEQARKWEKIEEDSLRQKDKLGGIWLDSMRLYPAMWTAYYFMQTEEMYFLKVAVAMIAGKKADLMDTVAIEVCFLRAHTFLESDPDERSVQHFLRLSHLQDRLQFEDYSATLLMKVFFQRLQQKYTPFDRLVSLTQQLSIQLETTVKMYRRAIEIFPKKTSLLQAFGSFLETIGKKEESQKYTDLIMALQVKKRRRYFTGAERLLMDDAKTIVFVVPVTGAEKGLILWTLNASALGYSDENLRGMSYNILIPELFKSKHSSLIDFIAQKRTVPRVLQSLYKMYLVNKQGELMYGMWRVFVTNDRDSGDLVVVATVRVESVPKEFGILGPFGGVMECTSGFSEMIRNTQFLSEYDHKSESIVWRGEWTTSQILVTKDEWNLYDHIRIPILVLYRLRNRGSVLNYIPRYQGAGEQKQIIGSKEDQVELFFSRVSKLSSVGTIQRETMWPDSKIKCIVNYRISRRRLLIRRYRNILLFLLFFTFLCSFAVSFAIFDLFKTGVINLDESIASISSFGMRRLSVRLAIRSKELFLINSNFTLYTNETASREELSAGAIQMEQMKLSLIGNASNSRGKFRSLLLKQITPFWKYENTQFRLYFVTLLDLMDEMAQSSRKLAMCPLANITKDNSEFMTLYRNGFAEGLEAFNRTVAAFCESKDEEKMSLFQILAIVAAGSPCGLLAISLFGGVSILIFLERSRRKVWAAICAVPISAIAETLEMVHSRLYIVHKDDSDSSDEGNVAVLKRRSVKYQMSGIMKLLCGMVVLYSVTASFAGLLLYELASSRMETILLYKPTYMNWLGLRRVLAVKSQFLMREAWLPPSLSYPSVVANSQTEYNSVISWEQTYSFLHETHHCFVSGCKNTDINHLFPTNSHKDLLLGSCKNCTIALQAGITPLINEVVLMSAAAREDVLANNTSDYSKGKKVEKLISVLLTALTTSNDQFNSDCEKAIKDASDYLLIELIASECGLLLAFLLVIVPLLFRVAGRIETELMAIAYFPKWSLGKVAVQI